jgi:hypothetical protein
MPNVLRWLTFLALLISLGCAVWAAQQKIDPSPIDLSVATDYLEFTSGKNGDALAPLFVKYVSGSGPGKIEGLDFAVEVKTSWSVERRDPSGRPLTLQNITVDRGTELSLKRLPGRKTEFLLTYAPGEAGSLNLIAVGSVRLVVDGQLRDLEAINPIVLDISARDRPLGARFELDEQEWLDRGPRPATRLSFFETVLSKEGEPQFFSAIQQGSVRFSDIETDDGRNKQLELAQGQPFQLTPVAGSLGSLKLSADGIRVRYSGTASQLQTLASGWSSGPVTVHMPTYLEWAWPKTITKALLALVALLLAAAAIQGADRCPIPSRQVRRQSAK